MWKGRTVYLIGGGPSLKGFDLTCLRGCGVVVAINDALLHAPWADACLTIDMKWLARRTEALAAFAGERICAVPPLWKPKPPLAREQFTTYIRMNRAGVSGCPSILRTGGNSGYAALNLAIQRGAANVALLGYDMNAPGHWHKGYDWYSRYGPLHYELWACHFQCLVPVAAKRGTRVINCNRWSRINCFPFGEWQEVAE